MNSKHFLLIEGAVKKPNYRFLKSSPTEFLESPLCNFSSSLQLCLYSDSSPRIALPSFLHHVALGPADLVLRASFVRVFAVRRCVTQQILRSVEAQLHSVFTLEQPALRCSLLFVMLLETPQVIVVLLFSAGNLLFLECTVVQRSMSS